MEEAPTGRWYARPVFLVADVEKALAFYTAVLGYEEKWRHGEPLVAVQVDRGGSEIILNLDAERAGGSRLFIALEQGQIEAVAAEITAGGGRVETGHWGMPVKIVRDPEGNELFFFDDEKQADGA